MKVLNNFFFLKKNPRITFIVTFVFLIIGFDLFIYSSVSIRCAKFDNVSRVKGSKKLNYIFVQDNKIVSGRMDITTLSNDEIEKLKKSNCIEVEVSNYWSFFNKVVEEK